MYFGLVGKTLDYSFSQIIHNRINKYEYSLFSMNEEELIEMLTLKKFSGLNITIPYKKMVIPYCDIITPLAKEIGAVNTLYFDDGKLIGDNTDYYGFIYAINRAGINIDNKIIAVLGTGATSQTIQSALNHGFTEKPKEIILVSRNGECGITYESFHKNPNIEIIIDTTPLGTYPNLTECNVDLDKFPNLLSVFDVTYNPKFTRLLLQAKDRHLTYSNGLPMLVAQAAKSAELFLGEKIPNNFIESTIDFLSSKLYNYLLIGMPGSGKSFLGENLGRLLNIDWFDMDAEIEKLIGMSCNEYITKNDENHFREKELQIAKRLSKVSGSVISTGGGTIIVPEAINLLRQNAITIFIDRPIDELETCGRPFSSNSVALEKLLLNRMPLYKKFADVNFVWSDDINKLIDILGGKKNEKISSNK